MTLEELRALSMEELFDNYPIGNSTVIDHGIISEGNVESRLAGDFNPVNVMVGYVNGDAGLFSGVSAATTVDEYYAWLDENYGEDAELMKELYPVASDEEVAAVRNSRARLINAIKIEKYSTFTINADLLVKELVKEIYAFRNEEQETDSHFINYVDEDHNPFEKIFEKSAIPVSLFTALTSLGYVSILSFYPFFVPPII